MSSDVQVQWRTKLYGPWRTLEREASRQMQHADHVKTNLYKCPWGIPRSQYLHTSTGSSLKLAASARRERDFSCVDTQRTFQSGSHLQLGDLIPPSHSLSKTDFVSKPIPQYMRYVADPTINLPDMAPKYMADRRVGTTQYKSHYDANKAARSVERLDISENKKTMRFHKSAHFKLGDHYDCPQSVTGCTFRGNPPAHQELLPPLCQSDPGRAKSYIFRRGDYNVASHDSTDQFTSTQKNDFRGGVVSLPKAYSHVLPRVSASDPVNRLRSILTEKNKDAFTNPRDPVTLNVVKAFANYDRNRCGSIGAEDIRKMIKIFNISIEEAKIENMLQECGCNKGEKLDFYEFCDFLTAQTEPVPQAGEFVSSSMDSYRASKQTNQVPKLMEYQREAEFQTHTHFKLGSDEPPTSSVYRKDFDTFHRQSSMMAEIEPRPRNSKVMQEYPKIPKGSSTTCSDFIQYDTKSSRADRSQESKEFKEKQEVVAVDIGSKSKQHKDKEVSLAMESYQSPQPIGSLVADPPVRKNYYHLESNRALPHPLPGQEISEVKEKYVSHLHRPEEYSQWRGEKIGERSARNLHNKGTHFVFGSSSNQSTTETKAQFAQQESTAATAAGIATLPTQGYSMTEQSNEETSYTAGNMGGNMQQSLQRHNYLTHLNPRDPGSINLRNAFVQYDTDRSGAISKDKLKEVCKKIGVNGSEEEIDNIIATCDVKGDGDVDYHEFALNLTQVCPPATREAKASVTAQDFIPPSQQRVKESQRSAMTKDSKRFQAPNIQQSHYFHMDHSKEAPQSTTRKDFALPETI